VQLHQAAPLTYTSFCATGKASKQGLHPAWQVPAAFAARPDWPLVGCGQCSLLASVERFCCCQAVSAVLKANARLAVLAAHAQSACRTCRGTGDRAVELSPGLGWQRLTLPAVVCSAQQWGCQAQCLAVACICLILLSDHVMSLCMCTLPGCANLQHKLLAQPKRSHCAWAVAHAAAVTAAAAAPVLPLLR
jgi:hypothetical protein